MVEIEMRLQPKHLDSSLHLYITIHDGIRQNINFLLSIKQVAIFLALRLMAKDEVIYIIIICKSCIQQLLMYYATLQEGKSLSLLINPTITKGPGIKPDDADITILTLPSIKVVSLFKEYGVRCISVDHVCGPQQNKQVKSQGHSSRSKHSLTCQPYEK